MSLTEFQMKIKEEVDLRKVSKPKHSDDDKPLAAFDDEESFNMKKDLHSCSINSSSNSSNSSSSPKKKTGGGQKRRWLN